MQARICHFPCYISKKAAAKRSLEQRGPEGTPKIVKSYIS